MTGAAGFIGSHLCERLLRDGYVVQGVDSCSDHYPRRFKELNLAGCREHPNFHFHLRDLVGAPLDELLAQVEVVYHLAARPGVRDSWDFFDDYAHANVLGAKHVLDACATHGARFVYASSSSVYGNAPVLPAVEGLTPKPISPYGATKAMAEGMAASYMAAHGFEVVILRYFTVYGPRQRPDMAIARFIESAQGGRPIVVFGDGTQQRDFTYVDDIVEGTVLAGRHGQPGEIYNLASSNPVALVDVLDEVRELSGRDLELHFGESQSGEVRHTWGDIGKAERDLGYRPRTWLSAGIATQFEEAERRRSVPGGGLPSRLGERLEPRLG